MKNRKLIFHVDVNSAFLSWSALKALKEHPGSVDLRTIPSAVGGDIRTRHGIITAKSIPAKKYGVKTGEPVVQALAKCPKLVLVEADFATYRKYSHAFIRILHTYSKEVEQVSIDEAYLDMTGTTDPVATAEKLKDEIRDTLGFTVNVGISTNKLLAKTASDFEKPDKIHTLWPKEIPAKLWPMPIGELHGCGKATASRLNTIGIFTVGDAAHTDPKVLKSILGEKGGRYIFESANGRGSEEVHGEQEEAKSYSNETTIPEDITRDNYMEKARPIIRHLSDKVSQRLIRDGVYGTTVTVSAKTDDFRRHSRQKILPESTNSAEVIYKNAEALMQELLLSPEGLFARGRTVRLMGVGVSHLDSGEFRQLSLFDYAKEAGERKAQQAAAKRKKEKKERLDRMLAKVNAKYGADTVRRGLSRKDKKGTDPKNEH